MMIDTGTVQVTLEKFYKCIQEMMLHAAAAAAAAGDDDVIVVAKAGTAECHYREEQRHSTQHQEGKGVGDRRDTEKWLGKQALHKQKKSSIAQSLFRMN